MQFSPTNNWNQKKMINNWGCFNPEYPVTDMFATIQFLDEDPCRVHIFVQDFDEFFHAPPDADIPVIRVSNNENLWVKKEWLQEISFEE